MKKRDKARDKKIPHKSLSIDNKTHLTLNTRRFISYKSYQRIYKIAKTQKLLQNINKTKKKITNNILRSKYI